MYIYFACHDPDWESLGAMGNNELKYATGTNRVYLHKAKRTPSSMSVILVIHSDLTITSNI